jgi:DNA polymerase I-like protein with 3'-5' exonuclease and polymerase domains
VKQKKPAILRNGMRVVVVVESAKRVSNFKLIEKTLEAQNIFKFDLCPVVLEECEDVKRRHIVAGREQLTAAIGKGCAVMLVGNTPLEAITDKKGIKQKRGRPFEQDGNVYLPIMPPGSALYDEKVLPSIEADLRLFAEICKKGAIPREEELDWTIVDSPRKFEAMLDDLTGTVSFDIETNGLYAWAEGAKVVSIGFGTRDHQWCLPLNHHESMWPKDKHAEMMARIDERLQDCYLVAHNGKFDSVWLRVHYNVDWRPDFDTMLAHWMLDENQRHGLKLLAQLYFGAPNYDADLDTKQGEGPLGKHCLYLAHDVYYTRALRFKFAKMLDEDPGVKRAFEMITMPIASIFCDVEFRGVLVDYDRFEEVEAHLLHQKKSALKELTKALIDAGISKEDARPLGKGEKRPGINWNSPKQIAEMFFDRLGIEPIPVKKKKGGVNKRSTAETVLKQLVGEHPVCAALMKYRGTDQQLKMFIEGWKPYLVKHEDGWRMHPSFKLHGTVTGRASCEHPNLQQVPRDPVIRSLIIAALGWELFDADLSQIEMRIAAELSGDQTLLGLFERDEDVHWLTAIREITRGAGMADEILATATAFVEKYPDTPWLKKKYRKVWENRVAIIERRKVRLDYGTASRIVYDMGPDVAAALSPVWKELRKKAKAINFGYLFGMWWRKMIEYARDNYGVHLTEKQAQESRKNYFDLYKELAPWHTRQQRYARRHGYVRSLSGAKRRLPDAMSSEDTPKRGEALRQAINSPVQRFACELNFMVLIQLIREFGLDVIQPIGTVHDAILMEVKKSWVVRVYNRIDEITRHPEMLDELGIKLRVPIKGDAKIGPWSKGVSLRQWLEKNPKYADPRYAKPKRMKSLA